MLPTVLLSVVMLLAIMLHQIQTQQLGNMVLDVYYNAAYRFTYARDVNKATEYKAKANVLLLDRFHNNQCCTD